MLAERLNISEGNLWYHFKTKRDILAAIQAGFAEDTRATMDRLSAATDPVAAYCDLLLAWRDLFTRYLFVFRDRGDYGRHSPDMIAAFPALYTALDATVTRVFRDLAKAGKLSLDDNEVPDLAFNAILITRFFLEFEEERGGITGAGNPDRSAAAMLRHLTLFHGRIDPEVEMSLRRALGG